MFDRPHYYVTFGGTNLSGQEIWQTGLRYAPDTTHTAAELLGALDSISVSDIFDDFGAIVKNQVGLLPYPDSFKATFAKVAVIGQDGEYAGAPKIHSGLISGFQPSSVACPPQLALVASLDTPAMFGKAQKGRMYWPLPINCAVSVDELTGQLPQGTCNSFRDLVRDAINAVRGEVDTVGIEVSAAIMSPSGAGTTNFIDRIAVGRVVDTQRRRRNALQEAYNYTAL